MKPIAPPDALEWALIALTGSVTAAWIWWERGSTRAWVLAVPLLVLGYMAGNMLYDLWGGRR